MKKAISFLLILSCIQLTAQESADYYSGKTEIVTSTGSVYSVTDHSGHFYTVEKPTNTLLEQGYIDLKTNKQVDWDIVPQAYANFTDFKEIVKNTLPRDVFNKYNSLEKGNIIVTFTYNPRSDKLVGVRFTINPCRGEKDILSFPPDYLEKLEKQFFEKLRIRPTYKDISMQICQFRLFSHEIEEDF